MKNLPEKIYLNLGDGLPADADFRDLAEVTWSQEPTTDNDVEYARPPQWISVNDRLPDESEDAILFISNGNIYAGYFDNDMQCWLTGDDWYECHQISYWMPILARPKAEKGGEG